MRGTGCLVCQSGKTAKEFRRILRKPVLNIHRVVPKINLQVLASRHWQKNLIPEAFEYFMVLRGRKARQSGFAPGQHV